MIKLDERQAAIAWALLAEGLIDMTELDIPKFADLHQAIRRATIQAHGHILTRD